MAHITLCAIPPLVHVKSDGSVEPATHPRHYRDGPMRVAVVGAGSCGTFAVRFLKKLIPAHKMDLHVFERSDIIGGRTASVNASEHRFEAGASMFIKQNRYTTELADELGINKVPPSSHPFAVWDGDSLTYQSSSNSLLNTGSMIWRYGLNLFHFKSYPTPAVDRFDDIYRLQALKRKFATPGDLWRSLDLFDLTQRSLAEDVGSDMANSLAGKEFITGILRNIYNQDFSINALAGSIALAPLSVGTDNIWSAEGGNAEMFAQYLSQQHDVKLHMNTRVETVREHTKEGILRRKLDVVDTKTGETSTTELFDVVILASPLEQSRIKILTQSRPIADFELRRYQHVHITVVTGVLRPSYFGTDEVEDILTPANPDIPFSCMVTLRAPNASSPNPRTRIVKFGSPAALTSSLLDELFESREEVTRFEWDAYPKFSPPEQFAPFELSHGLYYPSSIENGASAMEVMAVAAYNVALMVHDHFIEGTVSPSIVGDIHPDHTHSEL